MISFEEALDIVLNQPVETRTETIPFAGSPGRILAEDIRSDIDMPPFDKSAVDGFACRKADLDAMKSTSLAGGHDPAAVVLEVTETIAAGQIAEKIVSAGQCARIMTGAKLPAGADWVVMVEETDALTEHRIAIRNGGSSANICYKAEDIRKGEVVLTSGSRIGAPEIAVLASVGAVNPAVYGMPRIGIIATGDELVEPWEQPGTASIRNSNAWQMDAQVKQVPAISVQYGIAGDEKSALRGLLEQSLEECDVTLLTGGVSMGDYDYVPAVMQEAGITILFRKLAIQPGKPTVFGRRDQRYVFGLPGNPVSSYVLFEILVKPFLLKMMGFHKPAREFLFPIGVSYSRRRADRKSWIPVFMKDQQVYPVEYHGSAHINAYTAADAIMVMERGVQHLSQGDLVHVRLL